MYKKAKKQLYKLYSCHKFFHFPTIFMFVKFYISRIILGADFFKPVAPATSFHYAFGADFNMTA